jgi:hypothetical protein
LTRARSFRDADRHSYLVNWQMMNRNALRAAAEREGIPESAYSLDGGLPPDRYVLAVVPGGWIVYYSERGERTGETVFETEDEVCSYLLLKLIGDPTTRAPRARIAAIRGLPAIGLRSRHAPDCLRPSRVRSS